MIVCPNCSHPNPDGAVQCEACYTPLPMTTSCPNCGATVQADASFCGQCGYNLRSAASANAAPTIAPDISPLEVPPLVSPDPIPSSEPVVITTSSDPQFPDPSPLPPTAVAAPNSQPEIFPANPEEAAESLLDPMFLEQEEVSAPELPNSEPTEAEAESYASEVPDDLFPQIPEGSVPPPVISPEVPDFQVEAPSPDPIQAPISPPPPSPAPAARTQLQQVCGRLVHLQSDREIELPQNLSVIHIGKPNDRIPPDIDVSGFPNSEIVSRIHSDIRVEGDAYYIEDVGSSNGTYINNLPLLPGNRHRLRPGDRVSLGKGDLVTFLFQIS
ncbi:MAG: FHA domain-containing protein [Mastigocoleus sp. MO_167.B18]|uniref:FHA domain-containing protein n=1 Tax=Mastigocoleus sp. MO_188.B34 TaxID=3036635 RepID=UPI00261C4ECF|nr:FHA domain-containing protein [Mastigocoleus sp. MO_188.B34]MDJ0694065.1 FHA domain-containing protein [Mastigocoleus sp. MO_188.B34]MDJ0772729.1 FHA domain-containing protein [Mastigocoleus sp. MO_167.B18]